MITFIHPHYLIWLLLAIPLIIFYLWRIRIKHYEVATGAMWQHALPLIHPRRAWQIWRWPVSLIIQLSILFVLVLALAEPCWRRPQRVAVVLDMTSSMGVQADNQNTRLDLALEKIKNLVKNLGYNESISLIAVSDKIQILSRMTNNREEILKIVENREALPSVGGDASVAEAVRMARSVVTATTAGKYDPKTQNVVLISDGCFADASEVLAQKEVRWISVGKSFANVEIQNLAVIRRNFAIPQNFETLVTLQNHSPRPILGTLRLEMDGTSFHEQKVSLPQNSENDGFLTTIIPATSADRKKIDAFFIPDKNEDDFLQDDNHLSAELLEACAYQVTIFTPSEQNSLLERALSYFSHITIKSISVTEETPFKEEKAETIFINKNGVKTIPIYIYDRVLPENFDQEISGKIPSILFAPERSTKFWTRSDSPQDFVLMPWMEGEKYHFSTAGIGFVDTHLLTLTPSLKNFAETWLVSQSKLLQQAGNEEENLAKGAKSVSTTDLAWGIHFTKNQENLHQTSNISFRQAPFVLISCDISKSDWPLSDDFPYFLLYCLDWLAGTESSEFRLSHGINAAWQTSQTIHDSNLNIPQNTNDEFTLPAEDIIPMWSVLTVLLLAGLIVEWCFYQRRWLE
ncbi:MAG: VWA domain-containing protein [Planctomycetia bacterium]|nr:VWA domain-containing protein [Planctomycetia bacterium]